MESPEGRVLLIMRRTRRPIRGGSKGAYLTDTPPEDKTFDILDSGERVTGKIVYTEYFPYGVAKASTPWGDATIVTEAGFLKSGERGALTLMMEKGIIVTMIPHLFRWDFSFANGTVVPFKVRPGRYTLSYSGDLGSVKVHVEERRSQDSTAFNQWTFLLSGIPPTNEQDLVAALGMFESLSCLDFVNYYGA